MTRHTRINIIVNLLQQGPQTIESLRQHFEGEVSPRQIRSDVEIIKALGYGDAADFEMTGPANRKTWQIKVGDYERNTLRLAQGVLPQVFNVKRNDVLEAITNWAVSEARAVIESTHFYETVAKEQLDKNLEVIIRAIDAEKMLQLIDMNGDATSVERLVRFPLVVLPIKILYHRGCFYVAAVADKTKQVLTFQIDQIRFTETANSFDRAALINRVEANLANRFGISQNINDEVYDVVLRFSSVTGEFVGKQFWHDSQEGKSDGDGWLVTFRCGINRELVGWIFQWMSNVRVIGPPELIELYDEQLARILDIQQQPLDEPLGYTNRFAPVAD